MPTTRKQSGERSHEQAIYHQSVAPGASQVAAQHVRHYFTVSKTLFPDFPL
jgi:hypothetical protein